MTSGEGTSQRKDAGHGECEPSLVAGETTGYTVHGSYRWLHEPSDPPAGAGWRWGNAWVTWPGSTVAHAWMAKGQLTACGLDGHADMRKVGPEVRSCKACVGKLRRRRGR